MPARGALKDLHLDAVRLFVLVVRLGEDSHFIRARPVPASGQERDETGRKQRGVQRGQAATMMGLKHGSLRFCVLTYKSVCGASK